MTSLNASPPVDPVFTDASNPFKSIREQSGFTQQEIASRVGITKHAVLRNEQGMAVEPLPVLLNYFSTNFTVTVYELRKQYERFQITQRVNTGKLLGGDPSLALHRWKQLAILNRRSIGLNHPLVFLRESNDLNPTSLSRELCLNQSVINYFENNPVHQKTVPEQLLVALKQAGYSDDELTELRDAYQLYREWVLNV